jgi:hypothetical protein
MWRSLEVEPRGVFKLMTPMVARELGRRLDTAFASLKHLLEVQKTPLPPQIQTRGSTRKKVEPASSFDSNQRCPPCRSTSSRQMYSPSPVPPIPHA